MNSVDTQLKRAKPVRLPLNAAEEGLAFEIYVCPGFSAFETACATRVFAEANQIAAKEMVTWRFVSHAPGLLTGSDGFLLRAEPAIDDYGFSDVMIVVGGQSVGEGEWLQRARAMQRKSRPVILLSSAATTYIKKTKSPPGHVTTHWRHIPALEETGYHPNLTDKLSENADGIITSAGEAATADLLIGLLSSILTPGQVAELGNQLLLPVLRKSDADQPRAIGDNPALFDARVTAAVQLMEATIAEPLSMTELTDELGVSARHLERVFRTVFDQSPARFYKHLRTKRARSMIEQTLLPLTEIAVATGFGSTSTMSQAVRDAYGVTPSKMRSRTEIGLLSYK